jgi:hypothetical protein
MRAAKLEHAAEAEAVAPALNGRAGVRPCRARREDHGRWVVKSYAGLARTSVPNRTNPTETRYLTARAHVPSTEAMRATGRTDREAARWGQAVGARPRSSVEADWAELGIIWAHGTVLLYSFPDFIFLFNFSHSNFKCKPDSIFFMFEFQTPISKFQTPLELHKNKSQHEMQVVFIVTLLLLFYLGNISNIKLTHTSFILREYYFRCVVKLKVHSIIPYFITYL